MSTPRKDGGPAFPVPPAIGCTTSGHGMTLRDYFAGQALLIVLASITPEQTLNPLTVAACAYELADAMLKARE